MTYCLLFFLCHLECCETVKISSTNDKFTNYEAFGAMTYKKDSVDSRDRIIYKSSDYNSYGFGDFILYYEGPNEGGRQNWVVGCHWSKWINMAYLFPT